MDLAPILQKTFPQGSHQGQCVFFLHSVVDFPYMGVDPNGNDVNLKFDLVKRDGNCYVAANITEIAKGFRIGDCVFTTEGATRNWLGQWSGAGHMAIITGFDHDNLILAESNFQLDGIVRYGRRLPQSSPKIIGIGRLPFNIDLGLLTPELNVGVFINNQPNWNLKVLDDTAKLFFQYTGGKAKVNFFPVQTTFKNWWYEDFPFNGTVYRVIAKAYLESLNLPAGAGNQGVDVDAFIINPAEWKGSVYGNQSGAELAWTSFGNPSMIQVSCSEKDVSPWYSMPLITHALLHELGHYLKHLNGRNDDTDAIDYPPRKELPSIYQELDWNRIALNL